MSVRTIIRSSVLGAVLAAAAAGGGQAQAAGYQFSSFVPGNPSVYRFADCTVEVGVVLDPWGQMSSFQVIGGVRVNCRYRHRFIRATVREAYYQSSPADAYYTGTPGVGYAANSTGSGSGIAHTNGICGTGYWYAVAWVTTAENGTSAALATPANYAGATRC